MIGKECEIPLAEGPHFALARGTQMTTKLPPRTTRDGKTPRPYKGSGGGMFFRERSSSSSAIVAAGVQRPAASSRLRTAGAAYRSCVREPRGAFINRMVH